MKVAIHFFSAALLGLSSPSFAWSAAAPSTQASPAAAQNRNPTIDAADCDAEAEKAYPSYVVGVGKKRKALISVCMQRKTLPADAPRSISMDKVECEGESYKVYPPQIWGVGKKRKAQYSACMTKRGWTGDAIKP
jgi:hypothetical protein